MRSAVCILLLGSTLAGVDLSAHHAFTAEYDPNQIRSFSGIVTRIEWTNPHARIYIDVDDSAGEVTNWNFELGSLVLLRRLGWRRDSLEVGDEVAVQGYLAKDGSNRANASAVTLSDGRQVFAGSSRDNP